MKRFENEKKDLNKVENNNKIVNILLIILIILSICSALSIEIVRHIITKFYNIEELPISTTTLSCLILIFIPIITTIIGIIYKLKGFDSKKNIIIGSCFTLYFVFGIGMSVINSIITNYYIGYNESIKEYKNILNLDIPNDGYIKYDSDYFIKGNYKISYDVTIIDYSKVDTSKLLSSITENKKWFISNKIEKKLIDYLIPNTKFDDKNYFLFYNATKKEYNEVSSGNDMQEIYFIKYDIENDKLVIYNYLYTN